MEEGNLGSLRGGNTLTPVACRSKTFLPSQFSFCYTISVTLDVWICWFFVIIDAFCVIWTEVFIPRNMKRDIIYNFYLVILILYISNEKKLGTCGNIKKSRYKADTTINWHQWEFTRNRKERKGDIQLASRTFRK